MVFFDEAEKMMRGEGDDLRTVGLKTLKKADDIEPV